MKGRCPLQYPPLPVPATTIMPIHTYPNSTHIPGCQSTHLRQVLDFLVDAGPLGLTRLDQVQIPTGRRAQGLGVCWYLQRMRVVLAHEKQEGDREG